MTAIDESLPAEKPKRERKKREQPKIDAAAVLAATEQPVYDVGDIVFYRPADAARRSLKSNRGLDVEEFAAIITHIHPEGSQRAGQVSLRVFRPMGLQDDTVFACGYSAEYKPDTFRVKC